jgi:predicted  nucleic acid-binding Zn-ribbon protein
MQGLLQLDRRLERFLQMEVGTGADVSALEAELGELKRRRAAVDGKLSAYGRKFTVDFEIAEVKTKMKKLQTQLDALTREAAGLPQNNSEKDSITRELWGIEEKIKTTTQAIADARRREDEARHAALGTAEVAAEIVRLNAAKRASEERIRSLNEQAGWSTVSFGEDTIRDERAKVVRYQTEIDALNARLSAAQQGSHA